MDSGRNAASHGGKNRRERWIAAKAYKGLGFGFPHDPVRGLEAISEKP